MNETYSLGDYGAMIADADRFRGYAQAIGKAVRPGDAVLEIGCGPGIFALLACRAGARRVYAIESENIVQVARQLAAANGIADHVQFIQGDSRSVQLPERVNVIISDLRGVLPLYRQAIPSIEDARQRFLVPGGILIPQRDTLKAAVIEAKRYYSRLRTPWQKSVRHLDLSPSLALVLNEFHSSRFKNEQLLTAPQPWCIVDYTKGASARIGAELKFRAARDGTAHGVCVWFETQLFEAIGYSSQPGGETIYGQAFFPWLSAVPIMEDQEIQVGLHADLVGQDYVWRWDAKVRPSRGEADVCFQQSTFQSANFSSRSLCCHARDFVPKLSEEGQADLWLLQAMDGSASLQQIAQSASERFPRLFPDTVDAFRRAAELAEKLSR
jgi:type I protein arginine methyltransferase